MPHWTETPLFGQLQDEVITLMQDAQLEIARIEADAEDFGAPVDPRDRLAILRECSRITARLTAISAWLLLQQGIATGEVDAAIATHPDLALAAIPDPEASPAGRPLEGLVSPALLEIAEEACKLYDRIGRLAFQPGMIP